MKLKKFLEIVIYLILIMIFGVVFFIWSIWWYEENYIFKHDYKTSVLGFWFRKPVATYYLTVLNLEGSSIFLDGQNLGSLNSENTIELKITEGHHVLKIEKNGFYPLVIEKEFKGITYAKDMLRPIEK